MYTELIRTVHVSSHAQGETNTLLMQIHARAIPSDK